MRSELINGESSKHNDQPELMESSPGERAFDYKGVAIVTFVTILVIAAAYLGYETGASSRQMAQVGGDPGFAYLPVDSRNLTINVVPLEMGPVARKSYQGPKGEAGETATNLVSKAGLRELERNLEELYPVDVVIAEPMVIPDEYYVEDFRQYMVDDVLNWLVRNTDQKAFRTAGVMSTDISQPGYNFLFGLAKLGGKACVSSSARMGIDIGGSMTARERWFGIVRHELGHTLGLQHNEDEDTVMTYSNSLNELEGQSMELSEREWRRLEQLHPVKWDRRK